MRFFLFPAITASVVELSGGDFSTFISENNRALISFVAPWCGHCKELLPVLTDAEAELKSIGVVTAKVDATEETELASKYHVDGYPTIVYIADSIPVKYKGRRDVKSIVSWIQDREIPATVDGSVDDAKTASETGVAFFARIPEADVSELSAYRTAAKTYQQKGTSFYLSRGSPFSVEVFRSGERVGSTNKAGEIVQWISREQLPLFGEIDSDSYEAYEASASRGIHFLWVCLDTSKLQAQITEHRKTLEDLAKAYRSQFNFVWVDGEKFGNEMLDQIGCSSTDFPTLIVHKAEEESLLQRYRFVGSGNVIDSASIKSFLDRVVAGTEPTFFRSKETSKLMKGFVSEVNSEDVAKFLVTPKIDQLLLVTVSDVSVCPDCGAAMDSALIAKAWVEAEKPNHLQVYWIDGMENDPPSDKLHWDNVPNLLFVPAGSSESFKFSGLHHTPEVITNWIKSVTKTQAIQDLDNSPRTIDALPGKFEDLTISNLVRIAIETIRDDQEFAAFEQSGNHDEL